MGGDSTKAGDEPKTTQTPWNVNVPSVLSLGSGQSCEMKCFSPSERRWQRWELRLAVVRIHLWAAGRESVRPVVLL